MPRDMKLRSLGLSVLLGMSLAACGDSEGNLVVTLDGGGTSDGGSSICGTFCTPEDANGCVAGFWDCTAGAPTCNAILNLTAGLSCGTSGTCDGAGHCITGGTDGGVGDGGVSDGGTLPSECGRVCFPEGNSCVAGAIACTGETTTCNPIFSITAGTSCGTDRVCDGFGSCVDVGVITVTPASGAEILENSATPFTFELSLTSTPEAPVTVDVASGDLTACVVDEDTASFELSARDVGRAFEVRVLPVADGEMTDTRSCPLTFTTSEGTITRTLDVKNVDSFWVTRSENAPQGGNVSDRYSASPDGRYVVFSTSVALVEADDNDSDDVYAWDLNEARFILVSSAADGAIGEGSSYSPTVGFDGWVGFFSDASNLTTDEVTGQQLYFVKLGDPTTMRRAPFPDIATYSGYRTSYWFGSVTIASGAAVGFADITVQHPSGNYRSAAVSANLTTVGTSEPFTDLIIASHEAGDAFDSADSSSHSAAGLSADGRYLAFVSRNDDNDGNSTLAQLDPDFMYGDDGDSTTEYLLNVRDRQTDALATVELRSSGSFFYAGDANMTMRGEVGSDGSVLFASSSSYVDGDTNGDLADLYRLNAPFGTASLAAALSGVSSFTSAFGRFSDTFMPITTAGGRYFGFVTEDASIAGVTALRPSYSASFGVAVDNETGARIRFGTTARPRDIASDLYGAPIVMRGGSRIMVYTNVGLDPADTNGDFDLYVVPGF